MTTKNEASASDERATYYTKARSWADDRDAGIKRSRTTAWVIAGTAVGIAALEAVALAALAPLKSVEPYTILVDKQTGYTQMLNGDGSQRVTADEALTQSMLAQYVIARESFDIATVAQDYRKIGLWSADGARSSYLRVMQPGNPDSPISRLPRTSIISTRIMSVARLGPSTAFVRFETERVDQGQVGGNSAPWVAVVRYRFARTPMSLDDRLINPLGFQVTSYRRDQEAPLVASAPAEPANRPESGIQ